MGFMVTYQVLRLLTCRGKTEFAIFKLYKLVIINKNQLTVMCTAHGGRRLISLRCQKECLVSKLDGHTDVHGDYIAYCVYLLVVQKFHTNALKYCFY